MARKSNDKLLYINEKMKKRKKFNMKNEIKKMNVEKLPNINEKLKKILTEMNTPNN